MVRLKVDTRGFESRVAKSQLDRRNAAREATRHLGRDIVAAAVQRAPGDTNRYRRAISEAGNNLGGTFLLPPLGESRLSADILDKVLRDIQWGEQEVKRWQRNVASYEARGQRRSTKSFRDARKYLARWEKFTARAQEYLAEIDAAPDGAAIAIGLFGEQRRSKTKKVARLGALTRVVGTVYGGAGRVYSIGRRYLVEIHNKEPHASIVEKRQRVMTRSLNAVKSAGASDARGYGPAYLRRLSEAWEKAG